MSELVWQLVIAFCSGIHLNLTPCVLPVISLKVWALLAEARLEQARILADEIIATLRDEAGGCY